MWLVKAVKAVVGMHGRHAIEDLQTCWARRGDFRSSLSSSAARFSAASIDSSWSAIFEVEEGEKRERQHGARHEKSALRTFFTATCFVYRPMVPS